MVSLNPVTQEQVSYQRSYHWQLTIIGEDLPNILVASVDLPFTKVEASPYYSGGTFSYFPTKFDVDAVVLHLIEDTKGSVFKMISKWYSSIRDPNTGGYSYSDEYKKDAILKLLSNDLSPSVSFKLIGIWPTAVQVSNLDYGVSDAVRIDLTLSLDDIVLES